MPTYKWSLDLKLRWKFGRKAEQAPQVRLGVDDELMPNEP